MGNSVLNGQGNASNIAFNPEIAQQFRNFQQQFHGDPKAQINQMLQSGAITQDRLNQAIATAKQLQRMM